MLPIPELSAETTGFSAVEAAQGVFGAGSANYQGEVEMARNLMMIIGLSLAVVALGCPDGGDGNGTGGGGGDAGSGGDGGSGGTAGSGGDAGSGGTGGTVTDACTNTGDLMMLCMPGFGDDYISPCATDAAGDGATTSACLQEDPPGLSADCADCQGANVQCIRDGCVLGGGGVCLPPVSDQGACDDCTSGAGCDADLDSCAGDVDSACAG
jgi:hypothetical protein